MSTPRKLNPWTFATTTERDNYVAAQGALSGDVCTVDSASPRMYIFDGSAWNPYPWAVQSLSTGSIGAGSTNTLVRRWDNNSTKGDTSNLTYVNNSAFGGYWLTSREGIYTVAVKYLNDSRGVANDIAINNAGAIVNTFLGAHVLAVSSFLTTTSYLSFSWTGWADNATRFWVSLDVTSALGTTSAVDYNCTVSEKGYLA